MSHPTLTITAADRLDGTVTLSGDRAEVRWAEDHTREDVVLVPVAEYRALVAAATVHAARTGGDWIPCLGCSSLAPPDRPCPNCGAVR